MGNATFEGGAYRRLEATVGRQRRNAGLLPDSRSPLRGPESLVGTKL